MRVQYLKVVLSFLLAGFCLVPNLTAQQYFYHKDLVNRAREVLSDSIGNEVQEFLTLHPGSYYDYINRKGRVKKQFIEEDRKVREGIVGNFNILFALYDSCLTNRGVHLEVWVKLDSSFNLLELSNIDEIPQAFLNGQRPKWLPVNQVDSIISGLTFRDSDYEPNKRFYYNQTSRKYQWCVTKWIRLVEYRNELYQDVYELDGFSGEILNFSQELGFVIINKGLSK